MSADDVATAGVSAVDARVCECCERVRQPGEAFWEINVVQTLFWELPRAIAFRAGSTRSTVVT